MTKREKLKEAIGGVGVLAIIVMLLATALLFDDGAQVAPATTREAGR